MPSRQPPVLAEVDWMTSGRSQDTDLEGKEVYVKSSQEPQRTQSRLTGCVWGRGPSTSIFYNGLYYTPAEFVELAGWSNQKDPLTRIYVACYGLTADKVLEGKGNDSAYAKWRREDLRRHLKDDHNVTKAGDLLEFCKELATASGKRQLGRFAYRVCRPDEHPDGLRQNGVRLPNNTSSWRKSHDSSASVEGYFSKLTEHIKQGSNRQRAKEPFISATRDLQSAYYWGFGGVQPIVRIDLQKCLEREILYWDMHHDHFLTVAHARHFAETSAEVLLDDNIPADCCEVLKVRWRFATELQKSKKHSKIFPQWKPASGEFDPSTIEIVEALVAGSSVPLKVKIPGCGDRLFVMKRGGLKGVANPAHMSSEFIAQALYSAMGAMVPCAALSAIKVYTKNDDTSCCLRTNVLLMEFLEGKPFDTVEASRKGNKQPRKDVVDLCAADIAMANFDVAGPGFHNLLFSQGRVYRIDTGGALTYRPDGTPKDPAAMGASKMQVLKTRDLFAGAGGRLPPQDNFSKLATTRTTAVSAAACSASGAMSALFNDVARNPAKIAEQARSILKSFAKQMDVWFCENERSLDAHWLTVFNLVVKRLQHLTGLQPAKLIVQPPQNAGSRRICTACPRDHDLTRARKRQRLAAVPQAQQQTADDQGDQHQQLEADMWHAQQETADPMHVVDGQWQGSEEVPGVGDCPVDEGRAAAEQLHGDGAQYPFAEIDVCNCRTAKDSGKKGIGGYRKHFHEKYILDDFEVIDVTANGTDPQWRVLSPFFPHGGIPIPTCPSQAAHSVEGIWQGLKIMEDAKGIKGIGRKRFSNNSLRNLKRKSSKRKGPVEFGKYPEVIGHWCGPFDAETNTANPDRDADLFDYVQARKHIYMPAFDWVLRNSPAAHEALVKLAKKASTQKVVLLDYFTNGDVDHVEQPLSHGALIKKHLEENALELLSH